jgi:hypothetical protein
MLDRNAMPKAVYPPSESVRGSCKLNFTVARVEKQVSFVAYQQWICDPERPEEKQSHEL